MSRNIASSHSSSKDTTKISYAPLEDQQIRFTELLPGSRGSPIDCKIVHSGLAFHSEQYKCLSYMWGPASNQQLILVNGKPAYVRQNLHAALEAIREEAKPRIVWVDALCINQNDFHERNKQVAIMGKIFHSATKVLVWLGEAGNDSDLLFGHIKPRGGNDWGYYWDGPFDRRSAEAMLAFYSRSYWRRVWVIQEILGAKSLDLFCGTKCIPMDTYRWGFTYFLEVIRDLFKEGKNPDWLSKTLLDNLYRSPGCTILLQQNDGETEDLSLFGLLEMCANCKSESKIVHDRIYGLIGVLKSSQQGLIIPDYTKPISQVYFDVMISLFIPDSAPGSHWISMWGYLGKDLMIASRIVQRLLEYPLWNEKLRKFYPLRRLCSTPQFDKLRALRLDVWMKGVGAISEVSEVLACDEFSTSNLPYLNQTDAAQIECFQAAAKDISISEFHCAQEIGNQYMKKLTDRPTLPFSQVEDQNLGKVNTFHQFTGKIRTFITRNGLMGLASSTIQKGDLLYGFNSLERLFFGTKNLYIIIRPITDNSMHSFILIGHPIMLPVPEERYESFDSETREGKYSDFNFKDDLVSEGIDLNYEMFGQINCFMDGVTLFLLTR